MTDQSATKSPTNGGYAPTTKRRGRKRLILLLLGGLLFILLIVVALAPTIASSIAPGKVESALNADIKGRVKVAKASIGWFKTLEAGPVEVYDPSGALVARLETAAPVTVWKVLSNQWWSARRIELGTVQASGLLDLKQYNDGTTNLQRAFEPKNPSAQKKDTTKPGSGGGTSGSKSSIPSVQAALKLTKFDVSVRNESDNFKSELGLKNLTGTASVDADLSAAGGGTVKAAADISGSAVAGSSSPAAPMTLKLDADIKQNASGKWTPDGIDHAKVKLNLANTPIAVADAVAQLGGALIEGLGDHADITADIDGNATALTAAVKVLSPGLTADTNIAMKDGRLTARAPDTKPVAVSMKSTAFLERLPQTRAAIADAKQQIRLTQAPSIELSLDHLSIPLPKNGASLDTLDLRGANLGIRVKVSGLTGQVAIPDANPPAPAQPNAAPANAWKPFTVEPTELAINIEDLAKPIRIATGTKATLDGQPAGDLALELNTEGLLDANGRLRALQPKAGYANRADVKVDVKGVSTALIQPVIAGAGLPLDTNRDIGPTLDLNLFARANVQNVTDPAAAGGVGGGGAAALPPSDVTAAIRSNNINADIDAHLDKGILTTGSKGIHLTVNSAAPLAQRIVAASNKPAAPAPAPAPATNGAAPAAPAPTGPVIALSGKGQIEVSITDVSISLTDTKPEAVLSNGKANAAIKLTDLTVTPNMGGSTAPLRIATFTTNAALAPGAAPHITLNSDLTHDNAPFTLQGDLALEGLKKGPPKSPGPGALSELNPTGQIALTNLPRSALWMVKALNDKFSENGAEATKDDASRAIATAVREAIGPNLTTIVKLMPAPKDKGGGQYANIKLDTANKGASADLWARVSDKEAELSSAVLIAGINPQSLNPVLAALNKPAASADPSKPAPPPAPPMRIGAPSKLYIEVKQPARIPLITDAKGVVTPDFSKASDATIDIALEGDAVVEGVVMEDNRATGGNLRTATVALRSLKGKIVAPLSGLDDKLADSKRLTATLSADALDRTSGENKIGSLAINASATMKGNQPDGEVAITGLSTAHAESLIGQKDLLTGLLGETAELKLKATPMAKGSVPNTTGEVTNLSLQLTSPRVKGADIGLSMDDTKLFLSKPSTITLTPSADFINKFVLGGGQPATSSAAPGNKGARSSGSPLNEVLNKANPRGSEAPAPPAQPALRLQQSQPISIQIDKLSIAKPAAADAKTNKPAVGPLKPGVFDLGLSVDAPSMTLLAAADQPGGQPTPLTIDGLKVALRSLAPEGNGASPIEARLNIANVSSPAAAATPATPSAPNAPAQPATRASTAVVKLSNLADSTGVLDTKKALVNADVDIDKFPTPIVDSLANQKGLLTELLGPTVTLVATARNVTQSADSPSGSIDATATSQRATAKLKGDMRSGQFVQTGPVDVQVREIRTQLVKQLAGSLPLIESLEKTPPDAPAQITTEALAVPLNNDMTKLNGKVTANLGVARFTTSSLMGKLIKGLGGKEGGTIGRKIEPFVVNIDKGVARYQQFKLPFGEFNLETRGEVDLVNRKIDVVTYAPFFALSEEALGKIKLGIPGNIDLIDKATMVPITTKGSMDNPKTELDVGLFIKELGDKLLKAPGDLLKEPGKIIDNLFGPKDKPQDPAPSTPAPSTPKSPDATPPTPAPATPPATNPPAQTPKPKPKPKPKDQPK